MQLCPVFTDLVTYNGYMYNDCLSTFANMDTLLNK